MTTFFGKKKDEINSLRKWQITASDLNDEARERLMQTILNELRELKDWNCDTNGYFSKLPPELEQYNIAEHILAGGLGQFEVLLKDGWKKFQDAVEMPEVKAQAEIDRQRHGDN